MKSKSLKSPATYGWLIVVITFAHLIFMRFVFQEKWGSSQSYIEFSQSMAALVPMIKLLEKSPKYEMYWMVFYSILWALFPIFLASGYLSGYFAQENERAFIKSTSRWKLFLGFAFFFVVVAFMFLFPDFGTRFWFNELSSNPIIITFTCLEIAAAIFLLGRIFALIQIKLEK